MARPTDSNKIQILQANSAGVAPDFTLEAGELAINRTDNYLFYENAAGNGNTTVYLPTQAVNSGSSPTFAALTVDDITIDGSTITDGGDFTIDAGGDITIDAADDVYLKKAGTSYGRFYKNGDHLAIRPTSSAEIQLKNNAGLNAVTVGPGNNASVYGDLTVGDGHATDPHNTYLNILGGENSTANILFQADQSDDAGDDWRIQATTSGTLLFQNDIASASTYVTHMTITPHATITSSNVDIPGSLTLGVPLAVAEGGTALTSLSTLLNSNVTPTSLGLVIGTNVQAYDAQLDTLAGFSAAQVTRGIVDDNLMTVDDADAADNDYAKFTANGLEGRAYSEVRTDLGLVIGTDVMAHAANNVTGTGTDDYYARWTSGSALEGRTAAQVLSDIGAVALTALSIGTEGSASGDGGLAYNNSTGVFTYTPPADGTSSTKGLVELATTAEVETGSATNRAVTPGSLAGWLGSDTITTVGTIGTGTWQGTDVGVAYGGTGASSLTSNAILTGNGTSAIQAESNLTFNGGTLYMNKSSGDPLFQFAIGGSTKWSIGIDDDDSDKFEINSTSSVGSSDFVLESDGDLTVAGFMDIGASHAYKVGGTAILSDSSGTMTLSNVDALDATTAATIESSMESNLDTLNSVTSASSLATVGTIGTGTWQGDVIHSDYLSTDTAHLSGTQTFSGTKTFSNTITGSISGNAATATSAAGWTTARNFVTTGDVIVASTSWDGTGNFTAAATIQTDAVEQAMIADDAVDEARLQISNSGTNGYALTYQSGNTGKLTWASISGGSGYGDGDTIKFADGSAGTPGLSLNSDTNTGFYDTGTADELGFSAGGTGQIILDDGVIKPVTDSDIDLGTSSLEFKDLYIDGTIYADAINLDDSEPIRFGSSQDMELAYDGSLDGIVWSETTNDGALDHHFAADGGEDNADWWRFRWANGGTFTMANKTSGSYVAKFTLDTSGNLLIPGELQTSNIGYTDGDNAITIADGGGCTFPQAITASSTYTGSGLMTTGGNIVIPDNGYIGVATDTDMLQLDRTNQRFRVNASNGMNISDDLYMSNHIYMQQTKKVIFDDNGGDHTYISETSDDVLDFCVGGDADMLRLDEGNGVVVIGTGNDLKVTLADLLILDDDDDSYIYCNADDNMRIRTGGSNRIEISSAGVITFNSAFAFPAADGNANQILKTNGSGTLSWADDEEGSGGGGGYSAGDTIRYADGSAASPGLTLNSDQDTGFYDSGTNELGFSAGGTGQIILDDGKIRPVTDNDIDLGTSTYEFKDIYCDGTLYVDAIEVTNGGITQDCEVVAEASLSSPFPGFYNLEVVPKTFRVEAGIITRFQ